MTLSWYRTRGSMMVLLMILGITSSVCSMFLRFGRRLLLRGLQNNENGRIFMPTATEIASYQTAISEKYSLLEDAYAMADGLKIYLQQSGNSMIQNVFYNGWKHDHFVLNVLVFVPVGVVIAAAYSAPGSMHDSVVAGWGKIYEKLDRVYKESGGTFVVDSAFSRGYYPFLVKSLQELPLTNSRNELLKARQATSARQASEWGLRAFQGSFPRLNDRFIHEERGERKLALNLVVRLFNVRIRLVGINHILHTFMPHNSVE